MNRMSDKRDPYPDYAFRPLGDALSRLAVSGLLLELFLNQE